MDGGEIREGREQFVGSEGSAIKGWGIGFGALGWGGEREMGVGSSPKTKDLTNGV